MYVARLRYIQSIHEPPDRCNPDVLVRHFISIQERWRLAWLGQKRLSALRADPFYYYLIARTRYYDQVVKGALADGVQRIIIVGCGTDTRSYRFMDVLRSKGVRVLECDQPEAIRGRASVAKRWQHVGHIEYLAIDLNDHSWPELGHWLRGRTEPKTLVLIEGVSPYINDSSFREFLLFLASQLPAGSHVAYDFKVRGVNDDFGRDARTQQPFRLSPAHDEVAAFHDAHGLRLEQLELSAELCARMLPAVVKSAAPLFTEDGLVRLRVAPA